MAIVLGVLAINVGLNMLRDAFGGPTGPPSSSYTTDGAGTAAYAELLAAAGHAVAPLRGQLTGSLPRGITLFVLDPETLAPEEIDALREYVEGGGRLVIGGDPAAWLDDLVPSPPEVVERGIVAPGDGRPVARVLAPAPETAGVDAITVDGATTFRGGSGLPIVGDDDGEVATLQDVGDGRVILLADTSMLHNALLDEADNAAFGLDLAGPINTPVYFAEGVHGYGTSTGFAAIPLEWRIALFGLALAALVWMFAAGHRIGAPEDASRELPPPRSAYVEALATTLARAGRPAEAVAPVRAAARERLARRAGLGADASLEEIRQAAASVLAPEEVEAVFTDSGDDQSIITAGCAVVRLEGREW
jgi:hypothetical protein